MYFLLGLLFSLALSACAPKPMLVDTLGRTCYLGIVGVQDIDTVKVWAPKVLPGDVLIARECDEMNTEVILNEIRRDTR